MCGIFGLAFTRNRPDPNQRRSYQQFMEVLALTNIERGTDSTGIAAVTEEGAASMFKNTVSVFSMLVHPSWDAVFDGLTPKHVMVLGHTRAASHGEVSVDNAHPFHFQGTSSIIGTHNGAISNHAKLNPESPYTSDSQNLFAGMSRLEVDKIPTFLEDVQGSFALAMAINGKPTLVRNTRSPCYYTYIKEWGAYAYSSISKALYWAKAVCGLVEGKIRELPDGYLYTFTEAPSRQKLNLLWSYPSYTHRYSGATPYGTASAQQQALPLLAPPRSSDAGIVTQNQVQFYPAPGLREGETLREYQAPCRILCAECGHTSVELVFRTVNSRTICSFCWADRMLETAERTAYCSSCGQETPGKSAVVLPSTLTVCQTCAKDVSFRSVHAAQLPA